MATKRKPSAGIRRIAKAVVRFGEELKAEKQANPGALPMPHTPGPWKVMQPYRNDGLFQIRRWTCNSYTLKTAEAAEAKCAELNAAERVRDAAPQLLAACKAALDRLGDLQFDDPLIKQLEESIAAAEGTG